MRIFIEKGFAILIELSEKNFLFRVIFKVTGTCNVFEAFLSPRVVCDYNSLNYLGLFLQIFVVY